MRKRFDELIIMEILYYEFAIHVVLCSEPSGYLCNNSKIGYIMMLMRFLLCEQNRIRFYSRSNCNSCNSNKKQMLFILFIIKKEKDEATCQGAYYFIETTVVLHLNFSPSIQIFKNSKSITGLSI